MNIFDFPQTLFDVDGAPNPTRQPLLRTCERLDSLEASIDQDLAKLQQTQSQISQLKADFEKLSQDLSNLLELSQ